MSRVQPPLPQKKKKKKEKEGRKRKRKKGGEKAVNEVVTASPAHCTLSVQSLDFVCVGDGTQ
jgi:hypothetical protein